MSKQSMGRVIQILVGLFLVAPVGACARPETAYTGPGWYLEKPHQLIALRPQVFGGPFSYEKCEAERTKLSEPTASNMLCIRELAPPPIWGPY